MAASLASAMTSAVTSATTSSVTSAATAADLGSNHFGGPALYVPFGWAGPYVGATLGYEWGSIDNNPARPNGVAGGFEAGFNWQNGSFVYGGEADINFSAANDTFAPWQFSNPWFGTARGRAGIAVNNVLLFGTAGFAYGETERNDIGQSVRESYELRLGRDWFRATLVGQSRVAVSQSRRSLLLGDRRQ